jgi:DNA polymerase III delta subunit
MGGSTSMTLMELKNFINNGTVPSDFMIFVSKDSSFLATQYVKAIGKLADGGITKINSIYEPQQSSIALLTAVPNTVNVLKVETFDERAEDYSQFENTIVVCEQIDKSIAKNVDNYVVKFPKLEEWQIFDYAKTLCPNLDDDDISWLVKATNNDIDRVLNELSKVTLFDKNEQKAIFSSIRFDQQTDLYTADLFTIVNALVEGDMPVLFEFLRHNGYEDLEPVMLANRAFTSLKNILLVSQNPGLTTEDCGVSAGQFKFLRYKYRSLNIEAVKQKIKFLTNFDLMLKTSCLDLNKRDMLSYLVNNLNYKITM